MNAYSDSSPQATQGQSSGAGEVVSLAAEDWPVVNIGNPGYTEADGDAYWLSGDPRILRFEVYALGQLGNDFEYAVRTLLRFSAHPDPEVRAAAVRGATVLAQRFGVVEELREIGKKALSDEASAVRSMGRYYASEEGRFHTPEELAMQKRLSIPEFRLWLSRNDPEEWEKAWKYHRQHAEERKVAYAQMTKRLRKRYRQQFIHNDSHYRRLARRTQDPEERKCRFQRRIFEDYRNFQRRAWVPRWLP